MTDRHDHESRLLPLTLGLFAITVLGTFIADVWLDINYRLAANVALIVAAAFVNGFTLLYGLRSRWRAHRIGRIYLMKCILLSMFLVQVVLSTWWDEDYPYRQQIRFAVYTFTALVYIPMLVTLWREQQRDRHGERDEKALLDA